MAKARPSTISRDPYTAPDPFGFIANEADARPAQPPTPATAAASKEPTPEKVTTPFPPDLIERARTAVYWTPDLTLSGLIVEALAASLDRIEQERGGPFPPRKKLRTGRPVGSAKGK